MPERALLQIVLGSWIALAAITFVSLFFVTAPYGRHGGASRGPKVNATLGWVIMESPSVIVFGACFLFAPHPLGAPLVAFLVLWETHYLYRTYVFPFRRRGGAPMTVPVLVSALFFTTVNGWLNGRWLTTAAAYSDAWLRDPRFIAGVILFFLGFAVNLQSDQILFHLRKPGETGYKIPRGGLYRWVSCPNYLGEIVEWSGFALATWSPTGLAFALWTFANLAPRARAHHRWYRERFPDYPRERRAVIPLLF